MLRHQALHVTRGVGEPGIIQPGAPRAGDHTNPPGLGVPPCRGDGGGGGRLHRELLLGFAVRQPGGPWERQLGRGRNLGLLK